MLFNTLQYFIFLPIVFIIYWWANNKSVKLQNILLLIASYYFYACWDWRFLFLLVFSTGLDYYTGLKMFDASTIKSKKFWFWLSVVVNLGFLGVFKYYNFFAASFADFLSDFGFQVNIGTRQQNRALHADIINVDYTSESVSNALSVIDTHKVQPTESDFGKGNSAELFLKSLLNDDIWQLNHQKQFKDS